MPAAVMVGAPSPGFVGNPGPAADRIPSPAAVVVRAPIIDMDLGNPDITVGSLVNPVAVLGELVFIVFEFRRKIPFRNIPAVEAVPVGVPEVKIIPPVSQGHTGTQDSAGGDESLPAGDEQGAALTGGFHGAFNNGQFGLAARLHIETEKPRLQGIKRGIRSVKLETFLFAEEIEAKEDGPFEEMDPDAVVTLPGHVGKFNQSPAVEAEKILPAETELGAAIAGLQLIALDQGQVDHPFFRSEILGSLDDDMALDISQAGETVAVISFLLGEGKE